MLLLSGCPSVAKRLALKDCQFSVVKVGLRSVRGLNVNLDVTLGVYNPNEEEVIVDRFDYTLLINRQRVAEGAMTRDVVIPVAQSRELPLSVRINVVDAARVGLALSRRGERGLRVRGTYYVRVPWGRHPYPLSFEHRF